MIVTDISNFQQPFLKGDTLFYKQGVAHHAVEYLQSLIAATDNIVCSHVSDEDIEQLAYRHVFMIKDSVY